MPEAASRTPLLHEPKKETPSQMFAAGNWVCARDISVFRDSAVLENGNIQAKEKTVELEAEDR